MCRLSCVGVSEYDTVWEQPSVLMCWACDAHMHDSARTQLYLAHLCTDRNAVHKSNVEMIRHARVLQEKGTCDCMRTLRTLRGHPVFWRLVALSQPQAIQRSYVLLIPMAISS